MENLNDITDEELTEISYAIDEFLTKTVLNHNISPSQMTGITMARLLRMHETIGNTDNFYRLLTTISTRKHEIMDRSIQ